MLEADVGILIGESQSTRQIARSFGLRIEPLPAREATQLAGVGGDAVFEGYTETSDEKSALTVERYSCAKEDREPLF